METKEVKEKIKRIVELDNRAKNLMLKLFKVEDKDRVKEELHNTLLELAELAGVRERVEPLLGKGFRTVTDIRPWFLHDIATLAVPFSDHDPEIVKDASSYNELLHALHKLALRRVVEDFLAEVMEKEPVEDHGSVLYRLNRELIREAPEEWKRALERILRDAERFHYPVLVYDPAEGTFHLLTWGFGDVHGAHIEINTTIGRIHVETPLPNKEEVRSVARELGWEVMGGGFLRAKKYEKDPRTAVDHILRLADGLSGFAQGD